MEVPLNVCIITTWFPSIKHPNMTPFVYNFAKNLGKSGVSVSVITPRTEADDPIGKQDHMTIYRIEPKRFPLISILRLLNQIQPDIIHVHAPNFFTSNAIIASRLRNIPVVASVYRGEIDIIRESVRKPLRNILSILRKFTLNRFDKIIALSYFSKSLALKAGADENKITIIYNSCEEILFSPKDRSSARKKCNLPNDIKVILFVGNLIKLKGVDTLIKAIKILNCKFPNFFLVIIGQGEEKENLESLVREHNLSDKVKFEGWMPQKDLAGYYNAADVFVLPSIVEGHSIALLEAMASGLPIVASNIDGNKESIKDRLNGLLFKSGNEKMLAQCLEDIITNSQLQQQMSRINPEIYFQRFSTKAQIENYLSIYASLLGNNRGEQKKWTSRLLC